MEIGEYFGAMAAGFESAYRVAAEARAKGYDPKPVVEITPAPDLASRVEGIVGIKGLAAMIKAHTSEKTRQELAFNMVKDICSWGELGPDIERRLTVAVRVGLAVLTEGVVVASTEGVQRVSIHKSPDGSDYIAVVYAGPIRGAGGTSAALSVAMADYARQLLKIGPYKAPPTEVERSFEEIEIYHTRINRLQYLPSEKDVKHIIESCPVSIDGVPTEKLEVAIHRNVKRLDRLGNEEIMTNKVRGSIGLVICEGIAQKAKSVMKHTKNAGLDWSWLNKVIKADKPTSAGAEAQDKSNTTFLQDLVAGRPILAYPATRGSFRLRYGRSRFTGIAAKGFSPASMLLLGGFIATGTQLRVEKPGKGCVAAPVDTIEGPFVKLASGEALRVNSGELADRIKDNVRKIIAVGDILVTYGDFRKTNTQLQPSSYVEEYWAEQLSSLGFKGEPRDPHSFAEAYALSRDYKVPMHPRYTYEYADVTGDELLVLRSALARASREPKGDSLFGLKSLEIERGQEGANVAILEKLCVPHFEFADRVRIDGDDAQSMIASLGLSSEGTIDTSREFSHRAGASALEMVNANAPFAVRNRSTRIGARVGRPEKAKERLMKPAPNILFPIGEYGGKERNVSKAYELAKKKFGNQGIEVEVSRYRCEKGGELVYTSFCGMHSSPARLEFVCRVCGRKCGGPVCPSCGGAAEAGERRSLDIIGEVERATKRMGMPMPKLMKGVKGMMNSTKTAEPIEKGILRASIGIHIFKDGTSRFDATDMPITHIYPREAGVSVARLRELGYTKDYRGAELASEDQLVELRQQDVVLNREGAEHMLKVARFTDELLVRYYGMEPFYKLSSVDGLIGHLAITLSPHTSAGVLCRIIGFTDAYVGFAHPYTICARRRNCDGDEDTTMLLLDALLNFSRSYLPTTIGGTMDAPLILTLKIDPGEVDDEVHDMEVVERYGLDFYERAERREYPGEAKIELVRGRLGSGNEYGNIGFTHLSTADAVRWAPKRSTYTKLNTMVEKIDAQFRLADMLECVNRPDSAKRLILSHFIPDLIGNMHSFSRQGFRCVSCNAKYRRVPLVGKCTRCGGRIVLTISKGSIEKYLDVAAELARRYEIEPYIVQRIELIRDEIENVFGYSGDQEKTKQINLTKFM